MKRCVLLAYVFLTLFLAAAVQVTAASRQISANEWKQLTADKAFGYRNEIEFQKVAENKVARNFFSILIETLFRFFASPAGRMIIWSLLLLGFVYALYRILIQEKTALFSRRKNALPEDPEVGETPPEDIASGNWEALLREAMQAGNTRLAIRYSYMLLLQQLQQADLIQYRADKTNNDYYYELHHTELRKQFRTLSRQYEFAWYGQYPVKEEDFSRYMDVLNQTKSFIHRP